MTFFAHAHPEITQVSSGEIVDEPVDPHLLTKAPCCSDRLRPHDGLDLPTHVGSYEDGERFRWWERTEVEISSELGERF